MTRTLLIYYSRAKYDWLHGNMVECLIWDPAARNQFPVKAKVISILSPVSFGAQRK